MGKSNEDFKLRVTAQDATSGALGGVANSIGKIGIALVALESAKTVFVDSAIAAANYEATMVSLESVVSKTGRDMGEVYEEMEKQLGGLASKASVAQGFLKGMTTTLDPKQIGEMTTAIKNASIAMGEDFNVQLPMIIKAVKQLNPAILDNIGVTVRLDKVNKQIRDGYFGYGTAINEATQQNAIFQEIMKQTLQFQGQEEAFLNTNKGAYQALSTAVEDLSLAFGLVITEGDLFTEMMNGAAAATSSLTTFIEEDISTLNLLQAWFFQQIGRMDLYLEKINEIDAAVKAANAENALIPAGFSNDESDAQYQSYLESLRRGQEAFRNNIVETNEMMVEENENLLSDLDDETNVWGDIAFSNLQDDLAKRIRAIEENANDQAAIQKRTTDMMVNEMQKFTSSLVDSLFDADKDMTESFKTMAKHFMTFFIKTALGSIANTFIPGLGKLLGGIFDTPKYDRMAMTQGQHFAEFFSTGAMNGFKSFTEVYPKSLAFNGAFSGAFAGAGDQRQLSGNTYNFNAPVTNKEFVRDEIIPIIEETRRVGQTSILLEPESDSDSGVANVRL